MDKIEISEIQLSELSSIWSTIEGLYHQKEQSKKMYELENDKLNLTYIKGYQDALMDLEKCIEPAIEALDNNIKDFKNKSMI